MSEPCKDKFEDLCACLTGDLPDEKKRELEEHLGRCAPCASYFDELQNDHHLLVAMSKTGEEGIKRIEKNVMRKLGATQPRGFWRRVMKSKWTKVAAAALVIIGAVGFLAMLTISRSVAFADVVRPFITAHTATFKTTMQIEGMPAQTLEGMFMEPGYMRQTGPEGVTVISDLQQGKTVTLMPSQKLAMVMEMINMPEAEDLSQFNMFLAIRKRIQEVQETQDESVEFLGEEQIDGRLAIGYHVSKGGGDITVWADKETKMPIRLEIVTGTVTQCMSDIVFDVPLDESLFDLTIPEGYTVRTMQMDASPPKEEELVEMFGIWADYMDGSFPSALEMKSIMKEITEFVMGLREEFKAEGREPTEEEMQELQKRIMKVSRGVTFAQLLPPESDWHYAGKDAAFGDANTPIFWYRPEGSETYRVIYADLTVEDVAPENLPAVDETQESE